MRIVLVTPEFPPGERMGGIGIFTATTARLLAGRGHDVHVITRGAGEVDDYEGIEVVRLRHRWIPGSQLFTLSVRRRVASVARRIKPDVVQSAEWQAEAWWLARLSSLPVVSWFATPTYLVEELNQGRFDPRNALIRRLERSQAVHSDAVFSPTAALADRIAPAWGIERDRIRVIPHPLDIGGIRRDTVAETQMELPDRFIAFIGRLERRKGIETLSHALPEVLEDHPDLHVLLIGNDPREEGGALMERFRLTVSPVADRVRLLGELPRAEALAIVSHARLVVLPSLWENHPYVCMEAMALGRPVVASAAGGFVEMIDDEVNGWLVPPGDAAALATTLTKILGNEVALERAAGAARERAAFYASEQPIDMLLDLYREVIAERAR